MRGVHDLGGREGFGRVEVEVDQPVFHDEWERRCWGLASSTFRLGINNAGQFRYSIERMDPAHYLASRHYERWFTGVATRLVETGMISVDELEARAGGRVPLSRPAVTANPPPPCAGKPSVGDRVRVRRWDYRGHTRCPEYVRGKTGTVVRVDPPTPLPELEAHSGGEQRSEPQLCVRFEARELWGRGQDVVHVDLWVSYLEAG